MIEKSKNEVSEIILITFKIFKVYTYFNHADIRDHLINIIQTALIFFQFYSIRLCLCHTEHKQ